jgi:hypothetical protein
MAEELMTQGNGHEGLPILIDFYSVPTPGGIRLEMTVKGFLGDHSEETQTWTAYFDITDMRGARRFSAQVGLLLDCAAQSEALAADHETHQRRKAERKKGYES